MAKQHQARMVEVTTSNHGTSGVIYRVSLSRLEPAINTRMKVDTVETNGTE
jgi:hypothetical protein